MSHAVRSVCLAIVAAGILAPSAFAQIPNPSTKNPRFDKAVARGVKFLKEDLSRGGNEGPHASEKSLAAYALLKAGVSENDPVIKKVVAEIKARVNGGVYEPATTNEHIYFAGIDAMLLGSADGENSRVELQAIANYLLKNQGDDGSWDYPSRTVGDTSMAQYGVLGLWSCMRNGIQIEPNVWDKALGWHTKNKNPDGGWAYHPGVQTGPGGGRSTHNMTLGATGTMAICRVILNPEYLPGGKKRKKKKETLFGGAISETDTDTAPGAKPKNPYANYRQETPNSSVEGAIGSGIGWVNSRWRPNPAGSYPMYYYYAMERSFSMNDVKTIAKQDWFTQCGNVLLENQGDDGSWRTREEAKAIATSFAILFYMRSTQKILGKAYGLGIQIGDRGFNLDDDDPMNKKKKKKKLGPLDEMLARMDNMDLDHVKDVPEEDLTDLVDKILQSNRKELVGQMPLLKKMAGHPNGQVRSVVMFAMGRSGDMRVAPVLIDALNDNDVGVLSEAHTALCFISRKPRGFGISNTLAVDIEALTKQEEIDKKVNVWRRMALVRWRDWYKRIRPYDERGDLWEMEASKTAVEKK